MPAGNVSAQIVDENSTFITWNTPGSSSTYEFRYDDGNPVGQIGLNGQTFPDHVIGATHEYYAVVRRVEWFLTNNHTHPTVKIYIFGLTPSGLPDSDDLLYESGNISNVNNQWRSYTLPEAVVAPNGFLVGIATPNRWTDLAMDDGDDEPWVFENGTQYSTTNWENGVWSDISGFPDAGNLLLRAYGLNLGPPIGRDLEGYNVYRLPENNVNQPEEWELVAENIQDTTYTDSTWWYLDEGEWFYAVRCHHTNGIISIPSFSNILEKDDPPTYTVDLWITDSAGSPLRYVLTSLTSFYHTYAANSDIEGLADYAAVNPGIYDLHVTRNGYEDYDLEDILITENLEMDITLVSTGEDHNVVEKTTSLTGIYPNPFNPQTEIGFELAKADEVRIEVYNLKGQKVADLLNEVRSAGSYSINWNADDQPSGIYMIRFRAGGINQMQKAVLLK
jgi:hypothetical protein